MEKLLFVCLRFAPDNSVASIRPTKLVKYLRKSNKYIIDVLKLHVEKTVEDELLKRDLIYVNKVFEVPQITREARDYSNNPKRGVLAVMMRKIKTTLEYLAQYSNNRRNFKLAIKWIKENFAAIDYDVVISSSGPFLTHRIANFIKKQNPKIKWIADYRDPEPNSISDNTAVRTISRCIDRYITQRADHIVGATRGCFANMGIYSKEKCTEILNGFDRDDLFAISEETLPCDDLFSLSYTGTIHRERSDISAIFKGLQELADEGVIDRNRIIMRYAGRMNKAFLEQASRYNLSDRVETFGYVPREKSLEIQQNSRILLLASFDIGRQKDIVTGKFYEYLMSAKPIICTVMGTVRDSRLKEMIKIIDCGFCWEAANAGKDNSELKKYLKHQYETFVQTGETDYHANVEMVNEYDYKHVAEKLNTLIGSLLA